jgi:hypothetical protein
MKPETLIYDKVRNIIPENSEKVIFFVGITDTSQEVYFYSFTGGKAVQCYTLAEQYELDENELAEVFSEIVKIIRESDIYTAGKYNVVTLTADRSGISINTAHHDMDESEYKIQKAWKKKYIG